MLTASSPAETPGATTILSGEFAAIQAAPILLGLFLVSGIAKLVLPFLLENTVRIVLMSVGVLIASRALSGDVRADASVPLRLFMAGIATLITYSLVIIGLFAPRLSGLYQYVFLLFIIPGLYVFSRLFLSIPAVMVDGYGPFEALSKSWSLTDGTGLSIVGTVVLVFGVAFIVLYSLVVVSRSPLVFNVGSILLADMPLAGIQAFLYVTLTDSS